MDETAAAEHEDHESGAAAAHAPFHTPESDPNYPNDGNDENEDDQEKEYAAVAIQRWWRLTNPHRLPDDPPASPPDAADRRASCLAHQVSLGGTTFGGTSSCGTFASHWFVYKALSDPIVVSSIANNSSRWSRRFSTPYGLMSDVAASVIQGLVRRHNAKLRAAATVERLLAAASETVDILISNSHCQEQEYACFAIQQWWKHKKGLPAVAAGSRRPPPHAEAKGLLSSLLTPGGSKQGSISPRRLSICGSSSNSSITGLAQCYGMGSSLFASQWFMHKGIGEPFVAMSLSLTEKPKKANVQQPWTPIAQDGLMADVAASVIQGLFRRRLAQKEAQQTTKLLRIEQQERARKSPCLLPASFSVDCDDGAPRSRLASSSVATSTTVHGSMDFFSCSMGFQANIAASMIQGLWRRFRETSKERHHFKQSLAERGCSLDTITGSTTDILLGEERCDLGRVQCREEERGILDALIQREDLLLLGREGKTNDAPPNDENFCDGVMEEASSVHRSSPDRLSSSPVRPSSRQPGRPPRPPSRDALSHLFSPASPTSSSTRVQTPPQCLPPPQPDNGPRPPSVLFSFRPRKEIGASSHRDGLSRVFAVAHDEEEGEWLRHQLEERPWGFDEHSASSIVSSILAKALAHPSSTVAQQPIASERSQKSPPRRSFSPEPPSPPNAGLQHSSITSYPGPSSPLDASGRHSPERAHASSPNKGGRAIGPEGGPKAAALRKPQPVKAATAAPIAFRGLRLLHDVVWDLVRDIDITTATTHASSRCEGDAPQQERVHPVATLPQTATSLSSVLAASADENVETNEVEELRRIREMLVGLRSGFTVVRWRNLKDTKPSSLPPLAHATTVPSKGAAPHHMSDATKEEPLSSPPPPPPVVTSVAHRIASSVLAAIPGEASLNEHVVRCHKRHAEDAQRVKQQRREFREERRQELARIHRGPPSRGGDDGSSTSVIDRSNPDEIGGPSGSVEPSANQKNKKKRGDDKDWDAANTFDAAYDANEDSGAVRNRRNTTTDASPAKSVPPRGGGGLSTSDLSLRVEEIYGEGWQYQTIVPRHDQTVGSSSMKHNKSGLSASSLVSHTTHAWRTDAIDNAVQASMEALKALNERITSRGEQLRLSIRARKLSVKQRLRMLETFQKDEDNSDTPEEARRRDHNDGEEAKSPVRVKKMSGTPLPTIAFLESRRRILPPSASPTMLRSVGGGSISAPLMDRNGDDDDEPVPHRSASALGGGGGAGAPPSGRRVEQNLKQPSLIALRGVKPKLLTPIAFSSPVPSTTAMSGPYKSSQRTPSTGNTSGRDDEALLQQFLSEDDAGDDERRAHLERRVMRETYFSSICKRHDRLQKIGGVSEDLIRRHPGWLVKGAKLMPLHLPNASSTAKKKPAGS